MKVNGKGEEGGEGLERMHPAAERHRRSCTHTDTLVTRRLGLCWPRAPGLLPVSAASPSNGPRTWNSLPAELKTPDVTLCSFKRHLKAHLLQQ